MPRALEQVDVFSEQPYAGNPVAVVLDGEGLDDEAMQRFARWTNLSETTFVLPPTQAGADYRVRIFTTQEELPFAGHPTLGTCHAWLRARGGEPPAQVVQECAAGLITIRRTDAGLLGFQAPPLIREGPLDAPLRERVEKMLGPAEVVDAVHADNGPGWIAVLLADADAVLAVRLGYDDLGVGIAGPREDGWEVRAFFPADGVMVEDPVTGSFNASLAQWLLASGRAQAPYVARQGTAIGRAGRVHISQDGDGSVWVAGGTTTRIAGSVDL